MGEERVGRTSRRSARRPHDSRHTDRLIPWLALEPGAVGAQHIPVIRREDHDGVVPQAKGIQLGQHASDLRVDRRDHGVVRGDLLAAGRRDVGVRLQIPVRFVSGGVRAQSDGCGIVQRHVLIWCHVRIVGRTHLDGQEKRARVLVRPSQKLASEVRPSFRLEASDGDGLRIVAEVVCVEMSVADLVGGPAREALAPLPGRDPPGLSRPAVEVPLADEAGAVAGPREQLGYARFRFPQPQVVRNHAIAVGVLASENDGSRRATHGRVGAVITER